MGPGFASIYSKCHKEPFSTPGYPYSAPPSIQNPITTDALNVYTSKDTSQKEAKRASPKPKSQNSFIDNFVIKYSSSYAYVTKQHWTIFKLTSR